MAHYLLDQLEFARQGTLHIVSDVTESQADLIPQGFNNNIRWNLGHIYLVQEQFAFVFSQGPVQIPDGFVELFATGSKPTDWKLKPPTLSDIVQMLAEQSKRIRLNLENRLDEPVENPLTIAALSLKTVEEFLSFTLFHEGIHSQMLKILKNLSVPS